MVTLTERGALLRKDMREWFVRSNAPRSSHIPGSSEIVSRWESCYIRRVKLGAGKFQAAFCGMLLLLPSAIIHAAPGDRGRILPPEFMRPARENMITDKSRVVQLLMEKSNRERSAYEKFSVSKPSRIPIAVRRDAVEEIYRRSSGNGFEAFPRANQKAFRRVSVNSTGAAYHRGRMQIHGRDLDN